jgi:adenylate kinase family enzyme
VLSAADPLPCRAQRITVAGVSGSGKSTLARQLGELLDLTYVELDALYHGPRWTERPEFEADVEAFSAGDRWVCEWQYDAARPLLAARADLLVWVDLPFPLALARVVRRTVRRRLRRDVLWNGNREGPLHRFFTDPEHIVRWAISSRKRLPERVALLEAEHPHLVIVRLRSRGEIRRWVARVDQH